MKKKILAERKIVTVELIEWYTKEGEDVIRHWKFPDGTIHDVLTPYKELPYADTTKWFK